MKVSDIFIDRMLELDMLYRKYMEELKQGKDIGDLIPFVERQIMKEIKENGL